ncbi:MAG: hypothetical protein SVW77_02620 [Candidatus Nanohaloarchaea archaeon]|nr:hypothetical protein [Candidatus Nanohaloarchaea archaeon]
MATLPGLTVTLLDAAWQVALVTVPLLYLGFLGYGLARHGSSLAAVVTSQRGYTVRYGTYTVAGLLLGALPVLAVGRTTGVLIGAAITAAATFYGVLQEESASVGLDLSTWRGRLRLPWTLVPVLAVAAAVSRTPLLQSLAALVFLSAVFWEV